MIEKQLKRMKAYDDAINDLSMPIGADAERAVKQRVNQKFFREAVLSAYDNKCCISGISITSLLIASHIKPWAESSAKEKTSVENGLLLCPNHDRLFDKGYIAFENDGSILISSLIAEQNYDLLGINKDMRIDLTDENTCFNLQFSLRMYRMIR